MYHRHARGHGRGLRGVPVSMEALPVALPPVNLMKRSKPQ